MLSSALRPAGHVRNRPSRSQLVCVVDPRADDYLGWEQLAEANGVRLLIVDSAEAALRLARTATVDLWVVNANLPGLSGHELCSILKGGRNEAVVYLVADQYSPEAERAAWAARATQFGCKPGHEDWLTAWLQLTSHKRVPKQARCTAA